MNKKEHELSKTNMKGDDLMARVIDTLISRNEVFISNGKTSSEVFEDIASRLHEVGLVKEDFLDNIIKRESEYPTGMDLSVIDTSLSNIAIPHTESGYVNARRIIPIKLNNKVYFNNMINPPEKLAVRFLFMILNNDPEGQANILAEIMGYVASSSVENLQSIFDSNSTEYIYDQLKNKFE